MEDPSADYDYWGISVDRTFYFRETAGFYELAPVAMEWPPQPGTTDITTDDVPFLAIMLLAQRVNSVAPDYTTSRFISGEVYGKSRTIALDDYLPRLQVETLYENSKPARTRILVPRSFEPSTAMFGVITLQQLFSPYDEKVLNTTLASLLLHLQKGESKGIGELRNTLEEYGLRDAQYLNSALDGTALPSALLHVMRSLALIETLKLVESLEKRFELNFGDLDPAKVWIRVVPFTRETKTLLVDSSVSDRSVKKKDVYWHIAPYIDATTLTNISGSVRMPDGQQITFSSRLNGKARQPTLIDSVFNTLLDNRFILAIDALDQDFAGLRNTNVSQMVTRLMYVSGLVYAPNVGNQFAFDFYRLYIDESYAAHLAFNEKSRTAFRTFEEHVPGETANALVALGNALSQARGADRRRSKEVLEEVQKDKTVTTELEKERVRNRAHRIEFLELSELSAEFFLASVSSLSHIYRLEAGHYNKRLLEKLLITASHWLPWASPDTTKFGAFGSGLRPTLSESMVAELVGATSYRSGLGNIRDRHKEPINLTRPAIKRLQAEDDTMTRLMNAPDVDADWWQQVMRAAGQTAQLEQYETPIVTEAQISKDKSLISAGKGGGKIYIVARSLQPDDSASTGDESQAYLARLYDTYRYATDGDAPQFDLQALYSAVEELGRTAKVEMLDATGRSVDVSLENVEGEVRHWFDHQLAMNAVLRRNYDIENRLRLAEIVAQGDEEPWKAALKERRKSLMVIDAAEQVLRAQQENAQAELKIVREQINAALVSERAHDVTQLGVRITVDAPPFVAQSMEPETMAQAFEALRVGLLAADEFDADKMAQSYTGFARHLANLRQIDQQAVLLETRAVDGLGRAERATRLSNVVAKIVRNAMQTGDVQRLAWGVLLPTEVWIDEAAADRRKARRTIFFDGEVPPDESGALPAPGDWQAEQKMAIRVPLEEAIRARSAVTQKLDLDEYELLALKVFPVEQSDNDDELEQQLIHMRRNTQRLRGGDDDAVAREKDVVDPFLSQTKQIEEKMRQLKEEMEREEEQEKMRLRNEEIERAEAEEKLKLEKAENERRTQEELQRPQRQRIQKERNERERVEENARLVKRGAPNPLVREDETEKKRKLQALMGLSAYGEERDVAASVDSGRVIHGELRMNQTQTEVILSLLASQLYTQGVSPHFMHISGAFATQVVPGAAGDPGPELSPDATDALTGQTWSPVEILKRLAMGESTETIVNDLSRQKNGLEVAKAALATAGPVEAGVAAILQRLEALPKALGRGSHQERGTRSFLLMELIDGDMTRMRDLYGTLYRTYYSKMLPTSAAPSFYDCVENAIQQAVVAMAVFQDSLRGMHRDLHPGNIFVKLCDNKLYSGLPICQWPRLVSYIDGRLYSLPNLGFVCKLADFGLSTVSWHDVAVQQRSAPAPIGRFLDAHQDMPSELILRTLARNYLSSRTVGALISTLVTLEEVVNAGEATPSYSVEKRMARQLLGTSQPLSIIARCFELFRETAQSGVAQLLGKAWQTTVVKTTEMAEQVLAALREAWNSELGVEVTATIMVVAGTAVVAGWLPKAIALFTGAASLTAAAAMGIINLVWSFISPDTPPVDKANTSSTWLSHATAAGLTGQPVLAYVWQTFFDYTVVPIILKSIDLPEQMDRFLRPMRFRSTRRYVPGYDLATFFNGVANNPHTWASATANLYFRVERAAHLAKFGTDANVQFMELNDPKYVVPLHLLGNNEVNHFYPDANWCVTSPLQLLQLLARRSDTLAVHNFNALLVANGKEERMDVIQQRFPLGRLGNNTRLSDGGETREQRRQALKRRQEREQVREAAQRGVRQRSRQEPLDVARKFYIGLHSAEDRKRIFLHHFGLEQSRASTLHRVDASLENPYDPDSWYTAEGLKILLGTEGVAEKFFAARYAIDRAVKREAKESSTRPELFEVRSLTQYFKRVLDERDDLIMKVVPLADADDRLLEEIYNEIVAGYFLNELVYGYSHVLSIHFMTIVDWFPTVRALDTNSRLAAPHQVIVSERLDQSLAEFLMDGAYLEVLRGALFQMFHALETAWFTNAYTHNDLHPANVMTVRVAATSALFGKDLLYRRLASPQWYRVPHGDTDGSLVKIIDFGRNRMHIPWDEDHLAQGGRHLHDRLLCLPDTERNGYSCERVNRQIDVMLSLMGLLSMPAEYWDALGEEESEAFFAMCERVLPFEEMNQLVAAYSAASFTSDWLDSGELAAEFASMGSRITASNLHLCPNVMRLLQAPGVFLYRFREEGATASDVLDDDFFSVYRTAEVLPSGPLSEAEIVSVRDQHAVVSFVTHPEEAMMLSSSPSGAQHQQRCSACHAPFIALQTRQSGHTFCGKACYEFKYLFGGATIYRTPVYDK